MTYVDLFLLHSPGNGDVRRVESWKACCDLKAEGKVIYCACHQHSRVSLCRNTQARSIGVSNYGVHHLQELMSQSPTRPAVNQVEVTPFLIRSDLVRACIEVVLSLAQDLKNIDLLRTALLLKRTRP